jgi:hypothetical protein
MTGNDRKPRQYGPSHGVMGHVLMWMAAVMGAQLLHIKLGHYRGMDALDSAAASMLRSAIDFRPGECSALPAQHASRGFKPGLSQQGWGVFEIDGGQKDGVETRSR